MLLEIFLKVGERVLSLLFEISLKVGERVLAQLLAVSLSFVGMMIYQRRHQILSKDRLSSPNHMILFVWLFAQVRVKN